VVVGVLAVAGLGAGCGSTDAAHVVGPAVTPRTVAPAPGSSHRASVRQTPTAPTAGLPPDGAEPLSQASLKQIDTQLQQLSRALDQAGSTLGPNPDAR